MGFLDEIGALAGQVNQGDDKAKVAGGLMSALQDHPGGLQGVLDNFRQNGMGDHVDAMATGQQQTTTPDQVQQGLGNTGLIEKVAERTGMSPEMVKIGMATVLPMVIAHFAPNGQAADHSQFGGMAQQLLSRFL